MKYRISVLLLSKSSLDANILYRGFFVKNTKEFYKKSVRPWNFSKKNLFIVNLKQEFLHIFVKLKTVLNVRETQVARKLP